MFGTPHSTHCDRRELGIGDRAIIEIAALYVIYDLVVCIRARRMHTSNMHLHTKYELVVCILWIHTLIVVYNL